MPATITTQTDAAKARVDSDVPTRVDLAIRHQIDGCPYAFYFNRVTWRFDRGQLTLDGCVPNFYLKQMLQTILRDIESVTQVTNNVEVVSSTGLSSVGR